MPVLFDGNYNSLTNLPILFDGNYNSLTNRPVMFNGDWSSLTGTAPKISTFVNDAGYLISEADGSVSNEIQNLSQVLSQNNSADNSNITNLADPINEQDAATKAYVDELESKVAEMDDMLIRAGLYRMFDVEDNSYKVVKIGDQVWMAENLKTTKYNDGTLIPIETDYFEWGNLYTPAYCWYDNDRNTYADTYGALYNWYVVGTTNLCPEGWHVPTDNEWKELEMELGMSSADADGEGYHRGTDEGSQLAGNAALWADGALDSNVKFGTSGFTALPGGIRDMSNNFNGVGYIAHWWSATENGSYEAWRRTISYSRCVILRLKSIKQYGCPVRCVRDN